VKCFGTKYCDACVGGEPLLAHRHFLGELNLSERDQPVRLGISEFSSES
jgi:hypothetical protein